MFRSFMVMAREALVAFSIVAGMTWDIIQTVVIDQTSCDCKHTQCQLSEKSHTEGMAEKGNRSNRVNLSSDVRFHNLKRHYGAPFLHNDSALITGNL